MARFRGDKINPASYFFVQKLFERADTLQLNLSFSMLPFQDDSQCDDFGNSDDLSVTNLLDNTTHRNTQVLSKLIAIFVSVFLEWRANKRALYLDTLLATYNLRSTSDTNLAV